jgi:hypothetical protein
MTITSYGQCTVSPASMTISSTNTVGTFTLGLAPPMLITDLLTHWTATVTCPGNPPQKVTTDVGWIWVYSPGSSVQPGADITGTYTYPSTSGNGATTSTWDFKPAN